MARIALFALVVASACLLQVVTAAPSEGMFDDLFDGLKKVAKVPVDIVHKKTEIVDKVANKVGEKVEKGLNNVQKFVNKGLNTADNLFHNIVDGTSQAGREITQSLVDQGVKFGVKKTDNGFYIIGFVPFNALEENQEQQKE